MVDRILTDVGNQPGNLPLLEFTLTLLWEEAVDGVLTHAAYERIGRVEGALTGYAEQVFAELNASEQIAVKKIFMQSVQPGLGTEDTRRVANRVEIGAENWPLVQSLADKRLVVTDRGPDGSETVEIIHEALIVQWQRLKGWIEADRAFRHVITLVELKTGKILSSLTGHQGAVRAVAFLNGGQQALSAGDDNRLILWNLQTGKPQVIYKAGESSQLALAIQPDGRSAFSITRDGDIYLWDLQDAYVLKRFGRHNDAIFDVDYTPDGKQVLSCSGGTEVGAGSKDVSLRLWDSASGRPLQTISLPSPVGVIFQCAVSPDGRWILAGSNENLARLWDMKSGKEIHQLTGYTDWVISIAFSPDGKKALVGSKDGSLIYWDLEQGSPIPHGFVCVTTNTDT